MTAAIIYVFVFLFGSIVGSFLNVCIYRMPRGESIVFPASHCPGCRRPIPWYLNIPFVSYLMLRGRCAYCKTKISFRYFAVEALTALMFIAVYWRFKATQDFVIYAALFSVLIIVSFIDIEHWIIPDELTIPGAVLGLILSAAYPRLQGEASRLWALGDSFFGMVFGFVSLYLIGVLGKIAYKKEAMGGGDLMLFMFIGAFLGWKLTVAAFFLAPVFGSIVGVPKLLMKKQDTIQYGPFLVLAAFVCVMFREDILFLFPV
ncbi:MAG: prepilin peptidase [Candidatus Omnitrophica bacterium]|nr:prepilin peptidase [Candidatus Omnitrophota bacterium]MDD5310837.1 prepilin peptidase [Candidatus Omnitrophota bacterium]MDD5546778.1 prepilin peptidase [Candidatus Omnitrophota bacterium]